MIDVYFIEAAKAGNGKPDWQPAWWHDRVYLVKPDKIYQFVNDSEGAAVLLKRRDERSQGDWGSIVIQGVTYKAPRNLIPQIDREMYR